MHLMGGATIVIVWAFIENKASPFLDVCHSMDVQPAPTIGYQSVLEINTAHVKQPTQS